VAFGLGVDGGGNGGNDATPAVAGVTNRGGGAGGSRDIQGPLGGSGIVIIRYPI
jgi:hypothetical protein